MCIAFVPTENIDDARISESLDILRLFAFSHLTARIDRHSRMAAENEKNGVPLCSKGCTDPGMSELLGTSPARWSIGTRKRATTVLLAHASGHHEVRLAKPTLAQRVRHTAVHCLHHVRSFRMSSMCMCLYLTALSAMLTCATCAEAFNYLLV